MLTLEAIKAATTRARAQGALFSIATDHITIVENGLEFSVRKASQLAKKEQAAPKHKQVFTNPFCPYDPLMYVADLSATHVCLLNKFSVIDYHILAVNKVFEHQAVRLNAKDIGAWWQCIVTLGDGVGFFNCGPESGASQPHKHMQIVPGPPGILATMLHGVAPDWTVTRHCPLLPVRHAFVRFGDGVTPERLEHAYLMCAQTLAIPLVDAIDASLLAEDPRQYPSGLQSYNALLTRDMLLLAPRRAEKTPADQEGVSVAINALGFAGHILTKTDAELQMVRNQGPLQILRMLGIPET